MNKFALDLSKFRKINSDDRTSTLKSSDGHEIRIDHNKLNKHLKNRLDQLPLEQEEGVQRFKRGGDVQPPDDAPNPTPNDAPQTVEDTGGSPPPIPAEVQALIPNGNNPPEAPPVAPTAPAQAAAPSDPFQIQQYADQQKAALEAQKSGETQKLEAQADPDRLKQVEAAQTQAIKEIKHAVSVHQETTKFFNESNTNLVNALQNATVDPMKVIHEMKGGGQIATGLGLILGGMGAGLTHGPNLAFQFLQNSIDRSVDAQKAEYGIKENLLSHNIQAMGESRAGVDLTRTNYNTLVSHVLDKMATQAQNPVAQANIVATKALFDAKIAEITHGAAVQKAMMGPQQGNQSTNGAESPQGFQNRMDYLKMNGQAPRAKDIEEHTIPGIGKASVPVTDAVREDLLAKQNLDQKLGEYIDFAKQNSGSINPKTIAIGRAKGAELDGLYRQATHGGVYKEGENEFIQKIIDKDPTKLVNDWRGVIAKAQELRNSNLESFNNRKKSLGIASQGGGSSPGLSAKEQSFADWAKKNPNNPKAKLVLQKLGIQ